MIKRPPNRKCSQALKELLDDISTSRRKEGMTLKDLHAEVQMLIGWDMPAFSTMIQNLHYWSKDFRNPSPVRLRAYYQVACNKVLSDDQLEQALS